MLNDEKYDFSKETNIKEKLYRDCLEKKKEIDSQKSVRIPVSLSELENKSVTKLIKNNGKDKEIKMDMER